MPLLSHMAKHDPTLDTLFRALADPTRREMFERLLAGPLSVGDLAEPSGFALPSVLGHLGKLEDGGLIHTEKKGRTRVCHAHPAALSHAAAWIDAQRRVWDTRLDRLEAYLDTQPRKENPE